MNIGKLWNVNHPSLERMPLWPRTGGMIDGRPTLLSCGTAIEAQPRWPVHQGGPSRPGLNCVGLLRTGAAKDFTVAGIARKLAEACAEAVFAGHDEAAGAAG